MGENVQELYEHYTIASSAVVAVLAFTLLPLLFFPSQSNKRIAVTFNSLQQYFYCLNFPRFEDVKRELLFCFVCFFPFLQHQQH
jgi:hypothetical protein